MSVTIGKKLRHLRISKRLTQQDVAKLLKISRSTVGNYEIGRRTPHLKELQRMADVFGVGLDYFGIEPSDEAFNLLARAKEVFYSHEISDQTKETIYREFMLLYLSIPQKQDDCDLAEIVV